MRLAFVTSLVPVARPDTGFEIANAAIVDALTAAGHEVVPIGFMRPGEIPRDRRSVVVDRFTIENAAASPLRKILWLAAALARGLPVPCAKLWLAGRGRFETALIKAGPFDAILFNAAMLPGALPALKQGRRFGLVEHNVEHVSAGQNAAHATRPWLKSLFARDARLLERIEHDLCAKASFVWFLAEEDRRFVGKALGSPAAFEGKSAVMPLVSTSAPLLVSAPVPIAFDVGLIGTWTWAPNYIGLDWFLREVCPHLPADIRVGIAGRLPAEIADLPTSVTTLGRVDDAGAFLGSCRTVALASRAGTGVQLKTIEAFQLGKPAVATTLSLRGFSEKPANVRIADDAPAFAAALIELVAEQRAGRVPHVDGQAFMQAQRGRMQAVIAEGLARITG